MPGSVRKLFFALKPFKLRESASRFMARLKWHYQRIVQVFRAYVLWWCSLLLLHASAAAAAAAAAILVCCKTVGLLQVVLLLMLQDVFIFPTIVQYLSLFRFRLCA